MRGRSDDKWKAAAVLLPPGPPPAAQAKNEYHHWRAVASVVTARINSANKFGNK
jgi:hypothetical protein